jgi:GH18 family chitinase/lysophospholipase L1-like esterase
MSRWQLVVVLAAIPGMTPVSVGQDKKPTGQDHRIVGYFPEWAVYQRKYNVPDIRADKVTHINYAFAKIVNGECAIFDAYAAVDKAYPGDKWGQGVLRGNFNQLQLLKKKHPHLKTLISVGGWTLSGPFSDAALTAESRAKFANSCVAFMLKYGFDGVDIDWEYPVGGGLEGNKTRPADKQNYTLLLAELRAQLTVQGKKDRKHYLLTIAAPAGPKTYIHVELDKIHGHLDWINLMTYDFHGSWSELTNFNAPLYPSSKDPSKDETIRKHFNVDSAVKAYRAAGVPADKIVLGVPFYGRGWGGVKSVNDGLYQPHAPNSPPGTWEAGVFDYKDLAAKYIGKKGKRFWHDEAKVPWFFDEKTGLMISYDDPESIRLKAEYVVQEKLGGAMFWEWSADDAKATLASTLHSVLRGNGQKGLPPVKIVALGDSITKGVRPGVKAEETFASLLQAALKKEKIDAAVTNVGIGGETTAGAMKRLGKIVALKPHIVAIMYGTNDSYVDKGKKDSRLTPDEYRTNLTKIVQELRSAKITPILMTEPCWGDKAAKNGAGEHPNARLETFMKICREVAAENKVPLVDHFAHWQKANAAGTDIGTWTTDQCHPNPRGHEEIARAMLPVVLSAVRERKD